MTASENGREPLFPADDEFAIKRPVILIVDDNTDAATTIALILETHGWAAITATCVRDALDTLDENSQIRIVVSDIRMPGVDGFDFLRVLKHRFPSLPIILVTGLPITDEDVIPLHATILQKPVGIGELLRAVYEKIGASWTSGAPITSSRQERRA